MATHHVRLSPYDPKTGALARRFTAGGQLFEAGRWYVMDEQACEVLRPLKQGSGAPFFQIVEDERAWLDIVRRELAEAMGGPGAAALASLAVHEAPKLGPPPKQEGEVRASRFAGLRASEVSDAAAAKAAVAGMMPAATAAQVPDHVPAPQARTKAAVPDLESMTKLDLVALGKRHDIELDPRTTKRDMIATLMAEVFDAE